MKFKIGDNVVVDRGWKNIYEGKKGKIIDISPLNYITFYKIKFEDNSISDGGFTGENLKLIEPKIEHNLKIGDYVKILDKSSIYNDRMGKIESIKEENKKYPITVRFDNGNIGFYNTELLEIINKMEALSSKYKEAYKQYEETKEIEKDLITKTRSNIKKQNELMETISSLGIDILNEAKK